MKFTARAAPSRRGILKAAGAIAAGIAAPAVLRVRAAYADYPDRPIKFVVANTPGGPSDIVGRIVAAALQQSTGKTFIIENRGGAGGNIGMEYVAHADPDGYTILLGTNAFSVNYGLYNTLPYDPLKDFVAVSELGGSPNIFLVKPDLPAKTMKDFVALARTNSEKFNASMPPIGTTPQIADGAAEDPRETAEPGRGGVQGRRRRRRGLARRHRADVFRLGGAVGAAYQSRHVARARDLLRGALARSAGCADHDRIRLSGFRLRDRRRAAGAGEDAAGATSNGWKPKRSKFSATQDMKDKIFQAGFLVRPKGADALWARMTKEMKLFKEIIDQGGIKKL